MFKSFLSYVLIVQAIGLNIDPKKVLGKVERAIGRSWHELGMSWAELEGEDPRKHATMQGQTYYCPGNPSRTIYDKVGMKANEYIELKGYGKIEAKAYGWKPNHPDQKFALAIHQVYSDGSEWEPIAKRLKDEGWFVLVPSWTSNSKTSPTQCIGPTGYSRWACYPDAYAENLNTILEMVNRTKFDAIMGFSWGGWVAGMRAIHFPDTVTKAALVAPAFLKEGELQNLQTSIPTAIFWGNEDRWVPVENSKFVRQTFKHSKYYHEAGDHCIHPSYEDKIVSYVLNGKI